MLLTAKVDAKVLPYQYHYTNPYVYIFWTGQEDCYECLSTIELIETTIARAFEGKYQTYVINYWQDKTYDYRGIYDLNSPLSIVLINVEDDSVVGSKKIRIQSTVDDVEEFRKELVFNINEFFQ